MSHQKLNVVERQIQKKTLEKIHCHSKFHSETSGIAILRNKGQEMEEI